MQIGNPVDVFFQKIQSSAVASLPTAVGSGEVAVIIADGETQIDQFLQFLRRFNQGSALRVHQYFHAIGLPAVTAHLCKNAERTFFGFCQFILFAGSKGCAVHRHHIMHIECQQTFAQIIHVLAYISKG